MKPEEIIVHGGGGEIQEFNLVAYLDWCARIFDLSTRKTRLVQLGFEVDSGGLRVLIGEPAYASAGNGEVLGTFSGRTICFLHLPRLCNPGDRF
jgi:hypothetical protein